MKIAIGLILAFEMLSLFRVLQGDSHLRGALQDAEEEIEDLRDDLAEIADIYKKVPGAIVVPMYGSEAIKIWHEAFCDIYNIAKEYARS